jgi:hypothetical protein
MIYKFQIFLGLCFTAEILFVDEVTATAKRAIINTHSIEKLLETCNMTASEA